MNRKKTYMTYEEFINNYAKEYLIIKNEFPGVFDQVFAGMGLAGAVLLGNGNRGLTMMAENAIFGEVQKRNFNQFQYYFENDEGDNVSFYREEIGKKAADYYKFTNGLSKDESDEVVRKLSSGGPVVSAVVFDKTLEELQAEKSFQRVSDETLIHEIDNYAYQTVIRVARTLRLIKEKNPEFTLPPEEVLEKLAKDFEDQVKTFGIFLVEVGYGDYDENAMFYKSYNTPNGYYGLVLITTYLKHVYPEEYGKVIMESNGGVKKVSKEVKENVKRMIKEKREFECIIKKSRRDSDYGRFVEISSEISNKLINYICDEQEENGKYSSVQDFAKRFIGRVVLDFDGDEKKGVLYLEILSRNFEMEFPNGNQDSLHEWIILRYPDYLQYTYKGGCDD